MQELSWDLSDLFSGPGDARLADDLGSARRRADDLAASYRGRLASLAPSELLALLRAYEEFLTLAYRPQIFASLSFAGQTMDEATQALLDRTRQATTEAFNVVKFIDIELKTLPQAVHDALLAAPELRPYQHFLKSQRKFAAFTLTEAEERLADTKALTGRVAFAQLYTEVCSRIRIPLELEGAAREVNVAEARALRTSVVRDTRRRATDGLMQAFEAQSHVLTFCFNTLFQDHALDVKLRGYRSVMEPTLLDDELKAEVVEGLMATTERHYPLAQRYLRAKARALELEDFSSHDLLAPVTSTSEKVPFARARQLVVEAFGAFDGRFADIANEFFERRWIDVLPRAGKRDGAFCSGTLPSHHPYVLLNYEERVEDVSTLAHELGHGIHFYLARRNSPLSFWPTTSMAETASVFGELLLMRRLMAEEQDLRVKRRLLGLRIEDILATVFNQVAYTRWEQRAHERRGLGVVPVEELNELWMTERRRLYGDAVQLFPRDRWGWLSIGHFVHYRFYCYSYAFGQLLVLALFRKYEEEGKGFVPRYLELLASGSGDEPQELLRRVGIDVEAPGFWDQGFGTLSSLVEEFEALVGA